MKLFFTIEQLKVIAESLEMLKRNQPLFIIPELYTKEKLRWEFSIVTKEELKPESPVIAEYKDEKLYIEFMPSFHSEKQMEK